jgi:hypothetical protein
MTTCEGNIANLSLAGTNLNGNIAPNTARRARPVSLYWPGNRPGARK